MASRTLAALVLASLCAAEPAAAQPPRPREPLPRPAARAPECVPAPGAQRPTPVVSSVLPHAAGYVIHGRCFGEDRALLQVYEGTAAVPTALVRSLRPQQIEVGSTPQGIVPHKVVIGGVESNVIQTTHCRCSGHGTCDARGVCACHAGWSGSACDVPR